MCDQAMHEIKLNRKVTLSLATCRWHFHGVQYSYKISCRVSLSRANSKLIKCAGPQKYIHVQCLQLAGHASQTNCDRDHVANLLQTRATVWDEWLLLERHGGCLETSELPGELDRVAIEKLRLCLPGSTWLGQTLGCDRRALSNFQTLSCSFLSWEEEQTATHDWRHWVWQIGE